MVNKKGQSGGSGFTLIEILIAVAVLVVFLIAIYAGYAWFSTTAKQYEIGNLQNIANSCEVSAKFGDSGKPDYCIKPKPIAYGSETRYVNCNFDGVKNYITDSTLKSACTDADLVTMCNDLSLSLGSNYDPVKIYVNNNKCSDLIANTKDCAGIEGEEVFVTSDKVATACDQKSGKTREVTTGYKVGTAPKTPSGLTSVCCMPSPTV